MELLSVGYRKGECLCSDSHFTRSNIPLEDINNGSNRGRGRNEGLGLKVKLGGPRNVI